MKKLLTKKSLFPGKILLLFLSAVLFWPTSASASCIDTLDFEFYVDNASQTVKFESIVSSDALALVWDFGDGDQSKDRNVKHKYDSAGYYKVCVTAYGFDRTTQTRCSTTVCKRVFIYDCDQLKADFRSTTSELDAKFVATSNSRTVVYGWDFGDGDDARGKEVKHSYTKEGAYKVCLIAKDTVTGCVTRVCKEIKVDDGCDLEVKFSYKLDSMTLIAEGGSNSKNAAYGWISGDGNTTRGDKLKHTFSKPGEYTVCFVAKDTVTGCVARKCIDITVGRKCDLKADFEFAQDGNLFKFKAKANESNVKFVWTFGDDERGTGETINHKYAKPGTYEVCVTAYLTSNSGNTACSTKVCKRVVVKDNDCDLKADFEYAQDGNQFKFRAKASETNVKFVWSFGDGESATGETTGHKYAKPGSYEVCVTAYLTTASGNTSCSTKVCKRVVVKEKDECDIKVDFKYTFDGKEMHVVGQSSDPKVLYYWSWGDGTSGHTKTAKHKYAKDGVYEICLTVFNPKTKCTVTICKRVKAEKPCNLRSRFSYKINGNKVTFRARSNSKNVVYGWDFGDNTNQRGNPVRHEYSSAGIYKVTLYAKDTVTGCVTEVSNRLIINRSTRSRSHKKEQPVQEPENEVANTSAEQPRIIMEWSASAYPVPSTSSVDFKADKELSSVKVFNASGVSVLESDLNSNKNVDITTLPTGYYFAHLTAVDGSVKIVKFVKSE